MISRAAAYHIALTVKVNATALRKLDMWDTGNLISQIYASWLKERPHVQFKLQSGPNRCPSR